MDPQHFNCGEQEVGVIVKWNCRKGRAATLRQWPVLSTAPASPDHGRSRLCVYRGSVRSSPELLRHSRAHPPVRHLQKTRVVVKRLWSRRNLRDFHEKLIRAFQLSRSRIRIRQQSRRPVIINFRSPTTTVSRPSSGLDTGRQPDPSRAG